MKRILSAFLVLCMLLGLASCVLEQKPSEEELENQISDIEFVENEANKAGSMWELVCRLFPKNVVFKNSLGKFTYRKVDQELALDSYDWSDLSGTLKGIDVSYYQGDIDWAKVKESGIKYAFIRCGYRGYTQGSLQLDKKFEDNIKGALSAELPVGVYFVTKALTPGEAKEEAEYVLDLIRPYNVTWPVVIDIEPTSNSDDRTSVLSAEERTANVLAFCEAIKEAGYTPMIYGGVGCYMNYLEFEKLEGIEKWFAQYFNQPYLRYEFGVWQASDSGSVPGIKGNVDIDYSIKDYGAGDSK